MEGKARAEVERRKQKKKKKSTEEEREGSCHSPGAEVRCQARKAPGRSLEGEAQRAKVGQHCCVESSEEKEDTGSTGHCMASKSWKTQ